MTKVFWDLHIMGWTHRQIQHDRACRIAITGNFQATSETIPRNFHTSSCVSSRTSESSESLEKSIENWSRESSRAPKIESKSQKYHPKRSKINVKKTHGFQHNFYSIFHGFGFRKRLQNQSFFDAFSQIAIFWKLTKTIEKPMAFNDFSGFEPPKNS